MEQIEEIPTPYIGVNRRFFSNIYVDPMGETIEANYSPTTKNTLESEQVIKENQAIFESLITKNHANLKQYKEKGGTLLFHDDELYKKYTLIDYNLLMTILSYDETANESFVSKDKGTWHIFDEENPERNILSEQSSQPSQSLSITDTSSLTKNLDKLSISNCLNKPDTSNGTCTSTEDSVKTAVIKSYGGIVTDNDAIQVEFESRFESGNLRMAIQINNDEYDLLLKNDINAFKYAQWFFFRLKVTLPQNNTPKSLKFNIINCEKEDSAYNRGSKILTHSKKNNTWYRSGKNMGYYPNGLSIETKKYYTLSFTVDIEESDTLFFCYHYPYTFSYLQRYLSSVEKKYTNNIIRREVLGKTLAGNNIDLLLITNFTSSFDEIAVRPAIIFTARVHPSESCSSFVMQGIIDFLVSEKPEAQTLRNDYVFKIVPMLNPDGVINGSTRCSLLGKDLNRLWPDPRENFCPSIFHAKEMIRKTLLSRNIFLYCDFHGHSNSNNFFLYGTETEGKEGKSYPEKVLSRLIQSKNDAYDHGPSTYKIVKSKKGTARAIVKIEFGVSYSYCLEASLNGVTIGRDKGRYFSPRLLFNISNSFCMSLTEMTNKTVFNGVINSLMEEETNRILMKQQMPQSEKAIALVKGKSDSTNKLVKVKTAREGKDDEEESKETKETKSSLSKFKKTISDTNINKLESKYKLNEDAKSDTNIVALQATKATSKKTIYDTKKAIQESKKKYKK